MRKIKFLLFLCCVSFVAIPSLLANQTQETTIYLPLVTNHYDASWQWDAPIYTTLSPTSSTTPVAAIDQQGRLHLLWDSLTNATRYIYHSYLEDGVWSSPIVLAYSLGSSRVVAPPLVDDVGILHFIWFNDLGYGINSRYRLLYARFDGTQWSTEQEVRRSNYGGTNAHLQLAPNNQLKALITEGTGVSADMYQLSLASGDWQWSPKILPSIYWNYSHPDSAGGVRIYHTANALQTTVSYSHWNQGLFTVQNKQLSGTVFARKTALDSDNNLHVFRSGTVPIPGGHITGWHHQCLNNQLNWETETLVSGSHSVLSGLLLTLSRDDQLAAVWEEAGYPYIRVATWQGCEQTRQIDVPDLDSARYLVMTSAISPRGDKFCLVARYGQYAAVCAKITP